MTRQLSNDPALFIPRDLSWLDFNERVLEQAKDLSNPLMERAKFLAIFTNNLDEFYMVRVAGLLNLISAGKDNITTYRMPPSELKGLIKTRAEVLIGKFYSVYQDILQEFQSNQIHIKKFNKLNPEQKKFVKDYFDKTLFPIVTPLAIDPGHPFPALPSKTIAFAINVTRKGEKYLAIIPLPKSVPRLIRLPSRKRDSQFILVEDVIGAFLKEFFNGYTLKGTTLFRVIRDSELSIQEFSQDLLKAIEDDVRHRTRSRVVAIQTPGQEQKELMKMLCEGLDFPVEEITPISADLDLTFLFELVRQIQKPELFFPEYVPAKIEYENIFDKISQDDFIIHLPFQSFYPTVNLIEEAAKDKNVLAIKMTLYRTNWDSAIIKALKEAAKQKKQVTILVEIKARFDEEINIKWARELEEVGCHVIYGVAGLKVHSKVTLIVRKEDERIRRYVHLSTGNYNEKTSRVYTDIGYFTSNEDIAKDISDIFNVITGYSVPFPSKRVITSPTNLRDSFFALVDREIKFHKKNKSGAIRVKMNTLEDQQMIEKLYEASKAGVKISMIIRGICCLVPEVKDLSETIKVKSVVGRFLEHSRIYMFNNNGSPRLFLSSADWMERNFDRRIELLFEIYKDEIKQHLIEILDLYWKDNAKSWTLRSDRTYQRVAAESNKFNVQEFLIKKYTATNTASA